MAVALDSSVLYPFPIAVYPGTLVGRDIPHTPAPKADQAAVRDDLA